MSLHPADVRWVADGDFAANKYSRVHVWAFDGGIEVRASASPQVVPVPLSDAAAVDPEEAFVAAVASCHMLWFLDFARRDGLVLTQYTDKAVGRMEKDQNGNMWIARIDLNIATTFQGAEPDPKHLVALHHRAHEACFIANSVRTEIVTNLV